MKVHGSIAFALLGLVSGCGEATPSTVVDLAARSMVDMASDLSAAFARDMTPTHDDLAGVDQAGAPIVDMSQAIAANYPSGPYGNSVGAIFPPLVWEGYLDPAGDAVANAKPFVNYGADAMRLSGKRYAMVHVADFY